MGDTNKMISKLIETAKKEDWDFIDYQLDTAIGDPVVVNWAYDEGLTDENGNVRDLAAGVLEAAVITEEDFTKQREKIAANLEDDHPYSRFRAACALAAHGPGEYMKDVRVVLREFSDDSEVKKIAHKYLAQSESPSGLKR